MTPYYADESVVVYHADNLDWLPNLPDASVDAVVTDPPYGLEFMGRDWDGADGFRRSPRTSPEYRTGRDGAGPKAGFTRTSLRDGTFELPLPSFLGGGQATCRNCGGDRYRGDESGGRRRCRCDNPDFPNVGAIRGGAYQAWCEQWAAECLRVLKPGGFLLAFGGTRTYHRLTCAIEDAGFEIRDEITWLYGSGFPKNAHVLKPGHEPIVVARRPLAGTVEANRERYGTGVLNIELCRGEGDRWPANVALDVDAAEDLDAQTGVLTSGANPTRRGSDKSRDTYGEFKGQEECAPVRGADSGGASRFFPTFRYEPKAPAHERPRVDGEAHETVKPLELMRWLVRLVTPPGGLVLDPFAGSGTTAEACLVEGFRCIAVERKAKYLPLIVARLAKPLQPVLAPTTQTDGGTQ